MLGKNQKNLKFLLNSQMVRNTRGFLIIFELKLISNIEDLTLAMDAIVD